MLGAARYKVTIICFAKETPKYKPYRQVYSPDCSTHGTRRRALSGL